MVKMAKRKKKIGIIFDSALGTHVGTNHIVLRHVCFENVHTYYDSKVWNYGTTAITEEIAKLELFEVMRNEKSSNEKQTTHQKGIWNIVATYSLESFDIVNYLEWIR